MTDCFVLTKDNERQIALKFLEQFLVVAVDSFWRDSGDLRNDGFDIARANDFFTLTHGLKLLVGSSFVNNVDSLVRQKSICNEARRHFGRRPQRFVGVPQTMVLFKARLQAFENLVCIFNRRLQDIDFLETPTERLVLIKNTSVFGVGCRSNAPELTGAKERLKQITRVHHTARCCPCTNDGMDLVDKQDGAFTSLKVG